MSIVVMNDGEENVVDHSCDRAASMLTQFFLHRPSLKDEAVEEISRMVNMELYTSRSKSGKALCEGGVLYIMKQSARWMIFGNYSIYHFCNGELCDMSLPEATPLLGENPNCVVRKENSIALSKGKHCFFVCNHLGLERLAEQALQSADTPQKWMENIVKSSKMDDLTACTVFLPEKRWRIRNN